MVQHSQTAISMSLLVNDMSKSSMVHTSIPVSASESKSDKEFADDDDDDNGSFSSYESMDNAVLPVLSVNAGDKVSQQHRTHNTFPAYLQEWEQRQQILSHTDHGTPTRGLEGGSGHLQRRCGSIHKRVENPAIGWKEQLLLDKLGQKQENLSNTDHKSHQGLEESSCHFPKRHGSIYRKQEVPSIGLKKEQLQSNEGFRTLQTGSLHSIRRMSNIYKKSENLPVGNQGLVLSSHSPTKVCRWSNHTTPDRINGSKSCDSIPQLPGTRNRSCFPPENTKNQLWNDAMASPTKSTEQVKFIEIASPSSKKVTKRADDGVTPGTICPTKYVQDQQQDSASSFMSNLSGNTFHDSMGSVAEAE